LKDHAENSILFLATHSNAAAQTLIHLKHQRVDIPIIGADALSGKTFADKIKGEIKEKWIKSSSDFCTLDGIKEIRFLKKSD